MVGFSGIHCGGHEKMSPTCWKEALSSHTKGAQNNSAPGTRITYAHPEALAVQPRPARALLRLRDDQLVATVAGGDRAHTAARRWRRSCTAVNTSSMRKSVNASVLA